MNHKKSENVKKCYKLIFDYTDLEICKGLRTESRLTVFVLTTQCSIRTKNF